MLTGLTLHSDVSPAGVLSIDALLKGVIVDSIRVPSDSICILISPCTGVSDSVTAPTSSTRACRSTLRYLYTSTAAAAAVRSRST